MPAKLTRWQLFIGLVPHSVENRFVSGSIQLSTKNNKCSFQGFFRWSESLKRKEFWNSIRSAFATIVDDVNDVVVTSLMSIVLCDSSYSVRFLKTQPRPVHFRCCGPHMTRLDPRHRSSRCLLGVPGWKVQIHAFAKCELSYKTQYKINMLLI